MGTAVEIWAEFAVCATVIGIAGAQLCRSADIIAEKTGLSRGWIGFILLATVTSLPELVTGVSAVTIARAPNIAVGDVFGSCVFNLAILIVLDFLHREESLYRRAGQGHILSAAFGIMLIGLGGLGILLGKNGGTFSVFHIGAYTPLIVLLYAVAARSIFSYEGRERQLLGEKIADRYPSITLRVALLRYAIGAVVVIAAGTWLPFVGVRLAEIMGWRTTFVGTIFVAAVTSLPELAVTLSALRLGSPDLAIANLLGSNLFDILVLAVDDLAFSEGPLLSFVSPTHAATAFSAVMMTGVVIAGLLYRPAKRLVGLVGWISIALLLIYLFSAYLVFLYGH